MDVDFNKFFKACDPGRILLPNDFGNLQDYIDFSSVRGSNIVRELRRTIINSAPEPTCQLLTGHEGCGKSVELFKLKTELEQQGFYVVYLESSRDLDMHYVGVADILVAIACAILKSLETGSIQLRSELIVRTFSQLADLLPRPIGIAKLLSSEQRNDEPLIERIINSSDFFFEQGQRLEANTNNILRLINEEILEPATEKIRQQGKEGLVVIVDDLDHLEARHIGRWKDPFLDPDVRLGKLKCHVVYTIPLALMYSSDNQVLINRLGTPIVLSMLPVQLRTGRDYEEVMALLQQMVLTRAFPNLNSWPVNLRTKVFDRIETLDRLCWMSGGHVKSLITLIHRCLEIKRQCISLGCLETVIQEQQQMLIEKLPNEEWEFLSRLEKYQTIKSNSNVDTLLRSLSDKFIFEYFDNEGRWFIINPILAEAKSCQMRDFFISYNSADKRWAEWMAWILEEAGYSVAIQAWDFRPGGNFVLEMQRAASGTRQTIAVLSENYLNAEYTHPEWAAAFARDPQGQQKILIPIRVGH